MGGRAVIREAEAQSMLPGTEYLGIFSRQRGEVDGARSSCSVLVLITPYLPRHSPGKNRAGARDKLREAAQESQERSERRAQRDGEVVWWLCGAESTHTML